MKLLKGATRCVLLVGKVAIKVPRMASWELFLHGLLANMQEAQFRDMHPALCPIVVAWPAGLLVVMRRTRSLTKADWRALNYTRFVNRPTMRLPVERKPDSFGWITHADGTESIVAVDYGS